MQFHANHESTSTFAGNYYQAMFEADKEADDPHGPYSSYPAAICRMTICTMPRPTTKSTLGPSSCAALNSLCMGCQLSSIVRMTNLLNVTFTMAPSDFEEVSRVVKMIAGDIDPQ